MLRKKLKDAIIQEKIKTLENLLKNYDIANLILDTGEPPLNLAIRNKNQQIVKLLLKYGASPNIEMHSPLKLAVSIRASSEIIIALLDHKAIIGENIDDVVHTFKSALKADENNDKIYQCIINHCIDSIDPIQLLLWIIALNPKDTDKDNDQKILTNVLSCILGRHQNILNHKANQKNNQLVGEALLLSAVKNDNAGMVKLLLQHKVAPNCYDERGFYPLHRAAMTGNIDIAELLIADGADVNAEVARIKTRPLYLAADEGNLKLVQLLINAGSDINALDLLSDYPLRVAIMSGHVEIAKLLLQHGAAINRHYCGESILCTAVRATDNRNLIKKLIEMGADVNFIIDCSDNLGFKMFPLYLAVDHNRYSLIPTLLEYGANPNLKFKTISPLHHAIYSNSDESVDIANALIAHGADLDAQNKRGDTPLHYADSIKKIELLLDQGARTTIKNNIGLLPLESKTYLEFFNKEEMVNKLEEVTNKYNEHPRSLKLLARCCIRDRLIKSTSDTSNTETFREKTAQLGLPTDAKKVCGKCKYEHKYC